MYINIGGREKRSSASNFLVKEERPTSLEEFGLVMV